MTKSMGSPVLDEVLAANEHELQKRLTEFPDLIPIEEFGWSSPLLVVGRETQLPSGAVDLIGIARSGEILIAEFKTGPQNPDFRHALAQAIDYGSDVWGMTLDEFESHVACKYFASSHCPSSSTSKGCSSLMDAAEKAFGSDWPDEARNEFLQNVAQALESGGFHYAVVAQRFTPAMERTANYLNEISPGSRFYLVELVRFSDGEIDAFEARTVLKPSKQGTKGAATKYNMESFLAAEQSTDRRQLLKRLIEYCIGLGMSVFWGSSGISLKIRTTDSSTPLSVAWIFPTGVTGWLGLSGITLGYVPESAEKHPSLRVELDAYLGNALALPQTERVSVKNLAAVAVEIAAESVLIEAIEDLFAKLATAATGEEESASAG